MQKRYRSNRSWRTVTPVTLGELREPVVFVTAGKVPIPDSAEFIEEITPYLRTLAAVDEGRVLNDLGQNADAQSQTVFVIRDEGFEVSINHFVVWGIKTYKVVGCQKMRGLVPFLEVNTTDYGPVSQSGFVLNENNEIPTEQDSDSKEASNPYWE